MANESKGNIASSNRKQNRIKKIEFKYSQQIFDTIPGTQIHLFKVYVTNKVSYKKYFILIN